MATITENIKNERDTSILRAHAIAAALAKAKPKATQIPSLDLIAYETWVESIRQTAAVVCTADGVSISTFYQLCGAS